MSEIKPTIGSLCTGYGGLDLAVSEFFDAETIWTCENDKFAAKVTEARFDCPNLGDLKEVNWDDVPRVDIVTAGFPCQPFSYAGKRHGEEDPRHLWPYIEQAICFLRPRVIVLENVRGHLTKGFGRVTGSLAGMGYNLKWGCVRASDAGAPHKRERVFIVAADPSEVGWGFCWKSKSSGEQGSQGDFVDGCSHDGWINPAKDVASYSKKIGRWRTSEARDWREGSSDSGTPTPLPGTESSSVSPNANSEGWQGAEPEERRKLLAGGDAAASIDFDWGKYTLAVRRWESMFERLAPYPSFDRQLNPHFVEWMMGLPDGWVTGLGLSRTRQLKVLGNGVVPMQAYLALSLLW